MAIPQVRTPLPVGDGASLIARRPDIREAQGRLNAAVARLDVAHAELYPRIQLGGSAGLIDGGTSAILTPLITWSFPNRTALHARLARAESAGDAALAAWDQAILRALYEVESLLAEYSAVREQQAALERAQGQADAGLQRAQARQRLGAENYLVVVDAQRSSNEVSTQRLQAELRLAQIQVLLFRALGGGWEDSY